MSVAIDKVQKELGKICKKAELAKRVREEAKIAWEEAKENETRIMKEELVFHAIMGIPTATPEETCRVAEQIALSHQMKFDDLDLTVAEVLERFKIQDEAKPVKTTPAKATPRASGKAAPAKVETEVKPKRIRATKAEMAERAAAQATQAAGGITFPGRIEQVGDDNEDEYDDGEGEE